MKLIIPMAGRGKRLRPQSSVTPKPLISMRGRSMVERIVARFSNILPRPITDCIFMLGPSFEREVRPMLIQICERHNARPHFTVQQEALGTAHAVAVTEDHLEGGIVLPQNQLPVYPFDLLLGVILGIGVEIVQPAPSRVFHQAMAATGFASLEIGAYQVCQVLEASPDFSPEVGSIGSRNLVKYSCRRS